MIFTTTPADRAALLIENTLWERERGDPEERVSEHGGIVDEVLKDGNSHLAEDGSTICLPLDANGSRLGVLYAGVSNGDKRFYPSDLLLLQGTTTIAADTLDRIIYTKRIEDQLALECPPLDFLQRSRNLPHAGCASPSTIGFLSCLQIKSRDEDPYPVIPHF